MNDKNLVKYMSGPWRILEECPAPRHNTARAGIGRSGGMEGHPPCVCPRGRALARVDKEKRQAADAARDRRYEPDENPVKRRLPTINSGPMMHVGGGPWALSPECSSMWHNTQRAAVGRSRNGRQAQCMCPRGVALRAEEKAKRLANGNGRRSLTAQREPLLAAVATVCQPQKRVPAPDMREARCRSTMGVKIADELGAKVAGSVAAHRQMCDTCPIKVACAAWATTNEGDSSWDGWDGMYGGLAPSERKKVRKMIAGAA